MRRRWVRRRDDPEVRHTSGLPHLNPDAEPAFPGEQPELPTGLRWVSGDGTTTVGLEVVYRGRDAEGMAQFEATGAVPMDGQAVILADSIPPRTGIQVRLSMPTREADE